MVEVLILLNGSWQPSVFKSLQDIPANLTYKQIDPHGIETKYAKPEPTTNYDENRKFAYLTESDPLYLEAVYKAFKSGNGADLSEWVAKIDDIKQRYPK